MGRIILKALIASFFWFIGFFVVIGLVYGAGLTPLLLFLWLPIGVALVYLIVNRILPPDDRERAIRSANIEKSMNFDWARFLFNLIMIVWGFFCPIIWLIMFLFWLIGKMK